ncbi:MAG TPA: 2-C-methyl-D-erythritol 4-phosphate cytidylyltransferase [Longimicrobiales bacterium]|nr:2-C-methyl-D-erythritol 4-phosphate cytidylyltransferase [Longimicrobiales bacterium]
MSAPGPTVAVVIPAAGSGRRMGSVRKQYLELAGEPVLLRTLRPFLAHPSVRWIVVALPEADVAEPPAWLRDLDARVTLIAGGDERAESVRRALDSVPEEADVVVVHDAARPLVTRTLIDRTLASVTKEQGAIAALPIGDTVKRVGKDGVIEGTPDRGRLWRAQTPQAFPRALLLEAYRAAAAVGTIEATDDAAVVERNGGRVVVVDGDPENLKVTEPADVIIATALLGRRGER